MVTSTGGVGESVHFFDPSNLLWSSVENLYFSFLLCIAYNKKLKVMGDWSVFLLCYSVTVHVLNI